MTETEAIERQIKALREQAQSHLIDARNRPWCATSLTHVAELETEQAEALERAKAKAKAWEAVAKAFDVDIEDGVREDMLKISERKSRWVDGIGIVFGPISKEYVEAIKEALKA